MSFKNIIFTTLVVSLPLTAMERSDRHTLKRPRSGSDSSSSERRDTPLSLRSRDIVFSNNNNTNNNNARSWDKLFKDQILRYGKIEETEFHTMPQCLIAPLWNADRAQGDIQALAEFIYYSLPHINHRADCEKCKGNSLIHLLAASGNVPLTRAVLTLHAACQKENKIDLVNQKGCNGLTSSHFNIGDEENFKGRSKPSLAMAKLLLEFFANHLARDAAYELTPLGLALLSQGQACSDIAKLLLTLEGSYADKSALEYLASGYKEDGELPNPRDYPILEEHCGGYRQLCDSIEDEVHKMERSDSEESDSSYESE